MRLTHRCRPIDRLPSHDPGSARPPGHSVVPAAGLALWLVFISAVPGFAARMHDRIVAVVNSEVITLSEVLDEIQPDLDRIREQFQGEERQRRLQLAHHIGLTRMIERKLQLQQAKTKGVEVADAEVRLSLAEMKKQGEKVNESDPRYLQAVKEQLILMRVVEREVRSGITVGDTEMRRYFKEHESRFALPEEYTLSQILIRPRSFETPEETRARADKVLTALKAGGKFEELALQYSDGENSTRGGLLGLVRQGELHPPIERALATMKPGETTEAIETPEGFHIIRVEERKPRQFRPFEAVKAEIQNLVYAQKNEDFYQSWIADLKNKAYIEIKF
ncbi:MAG TPA: peptidyl-prolyl cis-trans isomerase [Nitrospiraceae bacterium]|nr:peptidyl-prolyl cis-trans isomerase [Nitrospiraceae bacterium]